MPLEANKPANKNSNSFSPPATEGDGNWRTLGNSNVEFNHVNIGTLSQIEDPSQKSAPKQDFQNQSSVDIEKQKDLLYKQKEIIMREKRMEREKRRREYDTSKLISAVEFLSGPNDEGGIPTDAESEKKFKEMRKSLTKSIKSDFNF